MIVKDLENAIYHADREHVSKSWLDHLRKSPAHLEAKLNSPQVSTPAMEFGSAFHHFVLEQNTFNDNYIVSPVFNKRTKAGKADFEEFQQSNNKKIIIDQDELESIKGMNDSLLAHFEAKKLIKAKGEIELSLFSTLNGVKVKARFDKIIDDKIIVDLKSTKSASIEDFSKSIATYRYYVQAAFYTKIAKLEGFDIEHFYFIAVEKEPPFAVSVFELDEISMKIGNEEVEAQLELYKSCKELNSFPAYGQDIKTISLPNWAMNIVK